MMFSKFVIEQVAGATIVFALAIGLSFLLRKHSAASRHFLWWLAAVAACSYPSPPF